MLARFPLGFDLRKNMKLADGVLLKQTVYREKGIKLIKQFNPSLNPRDKEYLLITTFQLRRPATAEGAKEKEGFTAEAKAFVYHYKIEILAMPKQGNWKEWNSNFDLTRTIAEKL